MTGKDAHDYGKNEGAFAKDVLLIRVNFGTLR